MKKILFSILTVFLLLPSCEHNDNRDLEYVSDDLLRQELKAYFNDFIHLSFIINENNNGLNLNGLTPDNLSYNNLLKLGYKSNMEIQEKINQLRSTALKIKKLSGDNFSKLPNIYKVRMIKSPNHEFDYAVSRSEGNNDQASDCLGEVVNFGWRTIGSLGCGAGVGFCFFANVIYSSYRLHLKCDMRCVQCEQKQDLKLVINGNGYYSTSIDEKIR